MKVLVTGSSGYLGSNFMQTYKNIYDIHTFSLQEKSVEKLDLKGIDAIIHCAALVHQKDEHPYSKYQEINTIYPVELAKKAKENGVKQFVFISTIAVYDPQEQTITAATKPQPFTSYGKSKWEAEQQLLTLQEDTFTVTILRIPMVYGVDAPGNIETLIKIIRKFPILPFSGINNKRSFIYIGNVTNIMHQVLQRQTVGILLAADERSLSTTELITSLAKGMEKPIKLINLPFFAALLRHFKPQIYTKLYDNLEVQPNLTVHFSNYFLPYSAEEGLRLTSKNSCSKLYKLKQ